MRRLMVAAVLATSLATAPAALASRVATRLERAAILRVLPSPGHPTSWYHLFVRISTVSPSWAAVFLKPGAGHGPPVQASVDSFHRLEGRWRLSQAGTGGGCHAPARVVTDLRLACIRAAPMRRA